MKFLSFDKAGVQTFGAVVGDGVVDLGVLHVERLEDELVVGHPLLA